MADEPHAAAILAYFTADTSLTTYDGFVPEGPPSGYNLVYFALDDDLSDSIRFRSGVSEMRVYTHAVSGNGKIPGTAMGARIIAGKIRTALLDKAPTITGRICWPIRHEATVPPTRIEATGTPVFDQVDTWILKTQTA